jgi:hypothetical protein
MSFVSDLLAKIKDPVKTLPGQLVRLPGRGVKFVKSLPKGKRRLFFIGLGAVLLTPIICLIVAVFVTNPIPDNPVQEPDILSGGFQPQIPPEELFLSDEPDFLPALIPGREQRDSWTAEDAAPFWYNPLEEGERQWRNRVELVIDELLEHVP